MIRTKNVSECWWGFAEPINIASINRKDEIPSGKIKGLSITNVRCKGEGSIYIAGKDSAPIEDLTLNNIRLELEKTTNILLKDMISPMLRSGFPGRKDQWHLCEECQECESRKSGKLPFMII